MSIATQITALQADKTAIANAITTKGGTVGAGDGFDDFATDIGTIPTGTDTSDATISTSSQLFSGVTAYGANGKVNGSLSNGPLMQLYPFDYGSWDASNYYFTGKRNLQQDEPFASTDGKAIIVFPKALMGDAAPSDVRAGKIFTSANGIQSVGTAIMGPTYFEFTVTDSGGWSAFSVSSSEDPADVLAAYNNGELCVARVSYNSEIYFAPLVKIDVNDEVFFDLNTYFGGQINSYNGGWESTF